MWGNTLLTDVSYDKRAVAPQKDGKDCITIMWQFASFCLWQAPTALWVWCCADIAPTAITVTITARANACGHAAGGKWPLCRLFPLQSVCQNFWKFSLCFGRSWSEITGLIEAMAWWGSTPVCVLKGHRGWFCASVLMWKIHRFCWNNTVSVCWLNFTHSWQCLFQF